MRLFSRARRAPLKAAAIAVTATTILAGSGALVSNEAVAQVPVISIPPESQAAPLSTTQKSVLLNEANVTEGLQIYAAVQHAKELKTQETRTRVVALAKAQIGDRYVAGASGPNRFDCSGLTRYVFKSVTGKNLPHQSRAQYADVKRIKFKDAKPGDLVFFFRNGAHHVGIYIGGRKMVDAAGYGAGVRISPITGSWWSNTYSGMGRILPA